MGPDRTRGASGPQREELDRIYAAAYQELRRLAARVGRSFPRVTLSPTTLVDEAWAKLASSARFSATTHLHFKRIAARAMRQVLVEAVRRKKTRKRSGDGAILVTLDESLAGGSTPEEILALDAALEELAMLEPRQAQMVELRFFGGLDVAETAKLLQISEATVLRDWRAVKAWLARALRPEK